MSKEKAIGYAYDSMGNPSSLERQKEQINKYCEEHGVELQSVHESSSQTGKDKAKSFKEFLESQNEDVTVVVSQVDRLASDFDSLEEIADVLKSKNATVVSTREGENQYYQEVFEKKGVRVEKMSQVPFGYEMKDGELIQRESEIRTVAWIYDKTLEYSENPPEILTEQVKQELEAIYGKDSKVITEEIVIDKAKLRVKDFIAMELNTRLAPYKELGTFMDLEATEEMLETPLDENALQSIKELLKGGQTEEKAVKKGPAIYCRVGRKEDR